MPGVAARLGPFVGGLNSQSDPSSIEDNELADIVNFDIDLDGSLINRPPIHQAYASPAETNLKLLGWFLHPNGTQYLVGSTDVTTYYWTGSNWAAIRVGLSASAMVQYAGKAYFVPSPGSTNVGGTWDGTTWVSVTAIPRGGAAVIHKERMWVAPGPGVVTDNSRLKFSRPGNLAVWDSSDFLDINSGDGQTLVDIVVYQGNILCFKDDSTYVFAFESDPARGSLNLISGAVGVAGRDCVVAHENYLFVLHERGVYELVNYTFTRINYKVPFEIELIPGVTLNRPLSLSLVGDRLLVRYYKRIYVFGLQTRTWTRWDSNFLIGHSLPVPVDPLNPKFEHFAPSLNNNNVYVINETPGTNSEEMVCYIKSKHYDFASGHTFKRMFWWGIDVISNRNVTAEMTPVVYTSSVVWATLEPDTWETHEVNTWAQPTLPNMTIETIISNNAAGLRKFIKLLRSTRFRQVFFEVAMETNGTASQPAKLFHITAILSDKAVVTERIS